MARTFKLIICDECKEQKYRWRGKLCLHCYKKLEYKRRGKEIKEYCKKYRQKHKDKYNKKNREKYKTDAVKRHKCIVKAIMNRALKDGEIIKSKICQWCGVKSKKLEGHHPDYDKPLAVIWLCSKCHRKVHWKL